MLEITFCWRKQDEVRHIVYRTLFQQSTQPENALKQKAFCYTPVCSYESDNSDILKEFENLFIASNFRDLTMLRSVNTSDTEEVFRSVFIIKFLLSIRCGCKDLY